MSLHDETSTLLSVPPFKLLNNAQAKLLAFSANRLHYEAGETLIRQGDVGSAIFVLLEGEVEVSIASGGGERVVRRMGPNAFLGEIAVMEPTERTATVRAAGDVVALEIGRDAMLRLLRDVPGLKDAIQAHMEKSGYVYE